MMALRPGDLALSLPTRADDPLLAEAEEACAGPGRARLAGSRRPRTRTAPRSRRARFPAAAVLSASARPRTRSRRRPARLDGRLLPGRAGGGVSLGLGVLGCGSVFAGPYRGMIERLRGRRARTRERRLRRRRAQAPRRRRRTTASTRSSTGPEAVIAHPDVDVVLVLTSMNEHGPLTKAALEAGKHVLVEKPMATSLEEAAELVELSRTRAGTARLRARTSCSARPSARSTRRCARGEVGQAAERRARATAGPGPTGTSGSTGPGGGSLFDLGVYNVTSLCALFGPGAPGDRDGRRRDPRARRQRARRCRSRPTTTRRCCSTSARAASRRSRPGFTMQKYRSPAIELYGSEGTIQLLGDDWAPEGWELWRNEEASWRLFPESDPHWQWTEGLRHLVDCVESGRPTVTRPEHAYHALEIMLAAQAAGPRRRRPRDRERLPRPTLRGRLARGRGRALRPRPP